MTQRVKEFIEDYISEIELGRWEEVFDGWYNTTDPDDYFEDSENFPQLIDILINTLSIREQTVKECRTRVIEKYTEEIVNNLQHNHYNRMDEWFIRWDYLISNLNSILGFSHTELFEIFNEVDMAGVTPDYNNQRFVIEGL